MASEIDGLLRDVAGSGRCILLSGLELMEDGAHSDRSLPVVTDILTSLSLGDRRKDREI